MATKRTWQPKKVKRVKKHGFLKRMETPGGKKVIKRRRNKGRKVLVVSYNGK
jgi:large subunit ribosomal protein L34